MKKYLAFAMFASCGFVHAELKLPKGLFSAETIEDAKSAALDKKQAVAFLVSQRSLSPS